MRSLMLAPNIVCSLDYGGGGERASVVEGKGGGEVSGWRSQVMTKPQKRSAG